MSLLKNTFHDRNTVNVTPHLHSSLVHAYCRMKWLLYKSSYNFDRMCINNYTKLNYN